MIETGAGAARESSAATTGQRVPRRGFLAGGAALVGSLAGAAAGYKEHDRIADFSRSMQGIPGTDPVAGGFTRNSGTMREFSANAFRIREAQRRQSVADVAALKKKYEEPVFGKVRVWDMFEKLALCLDVSDDSLLLTSQNLHVQQILEGMERSGIQDKDMFLIALLHDLGKVMMLNGEAPENVVGYTAPIGEYRDGAGLDNVIFQFGHDEMIYSRIKDHVPPHVAQTIRYHSMLPGDVQRFFNAQDRAMHDTYLLPFHAYDQGMKSYSHLPRVEMAKYRALIEDTFPQPILF